MKKKKRRRKEKISEREKKEKKKKGNKRQRLRSERDCNESSTADGLEQPLAPWEHHEIP